MEMSQKAYIQKYEGMVESLENELMDKLDRWLENARRQDRFFLVTIPCSLLISLTE